MEKKFRKKIRIFSLKHPPATHECPQKNSAQSVQPFSRLYTWGCCRDVKRTVFYVLATSFYSPNDQTFDVHMTKHLTSTWPNFSYTFFLHLITEYTQHIYKCLVLLYRRAKSFYPYFIRILVIIYYNYNIRILVIIYYNYNIRILVKPIST